MNTNGWERLIKVIRWSGLTNHAFAMEIGLARSENIYRIIRDKCNLSHTMCMRIIEKFPPINYDWLYSGSGKMINGKFIYGDNLSIPYYELPQQAPLFDFHISALNNVYKAAIMYDHSMSPKIPKDACLIVEYVPSTNIIYGEIYSIQTDKSLFIRIVKGSETDKELLLKAINDKDYPEIIMPKKDIINIGRACGIVSKL